MTARAAASMLFTRSRRIGKIFLRGVFVGGARVMVCERRGWEWLATGYRSLFDKSPRKQRSGICRDIRIRRLLPTERYQ